jgi:hypothetical protein
LEIEKLEKQLADMKTSKEIELAPPNRYSFGTFAADISLDSTEAEVNGVLHYYQKKTSDAINIEKQEIRLAK